MELLLIFGAVMAAGLMFLGVLFLIACVLVGVALNAAGFL